MNPRNWRLLGGGALIALTLTVLLGSGGNPPAARADEAAKRYGVDPKRVSDGMDTWHWWCGVDNPGFWREQAKLTSKKANVLTARIDLFRMLHTVPRSERWQKIGLINDPDCVPAGKP